MFRKNPSYQTLSEYKSQTFHFPHISMINTKQIKIIVIDSLSNVELFSMIDTKRIMIIVIDSLSNVIIVGVIFRSFADLGAGLAVGLSGLAAGFAIGIVGDAGVRGTAQQPRLFVGMILILIFAEVLGLYGLIVALILTTKNA